MKSGNGDQNWMAVRGWRVAQRVEDEGTIYGFFRARHLIHNEADRGLWKLAE